MTEPTVVKTVEKRCVRCNEPSGHLLLCRDCRKADLNVFAKNLKAKRG